MERQGPSVTAIAHELGWRLVKVAGVQDRPGIAADIFDAIADAGIDVDLILQNVSLDGLTDISFTLREADSEKAMEKLDACGYGESADVSPPVALLSVAGTALRRPPGLLGTIFRTLSDANVNIMCIGTSHIKVTCVVNASDAAAGEAALRQHVPLEG